MCPFFDPLIHKYGKKAQPSRPKISPKGKNRMDAEFRMQSLKSRGAKMLEKYDTDKTGKLCKDQVVHMLTDMNTSTSEGDPPTDEELEFVLKEADVGGMWNGSPDGKLDADEVVKAIDLWNNYNKLKPALLEAFNHFDKDDSGYLDAKELKAYLRYLNDGIDVTTDETQMVLKKADTSGDQRLNKIELLKATSEWYTMAGETAAGSKSCVVQ